MKLLKSKHGLKTKKLSCIDNITDIILFNLLQCQDKSLLPILDRYMYVYF